MTRTPRLFFASLAALPTGGTLIQPGVIECGWG